MEYRYKRCFKKNMFSPQYPIQYAAIKNKSPLVILPLYYSTIVGYLIIKSIYIRKIFVYEKYDLNEEAINIIKSFHAKFKVKSLTEEGQEQKERLTSKLFHQKPRFQLAAYFFLSVLSLFKSLVLILKQKEPLIHRIHSMLCQDLEMFFACYVKLELITSLNPKDLKSIDAKNNVRKLKTLYVGDEAEKLAKYLKKNKILKPIVLDFHRTVRKAYIQAGNYLQQKYPVENPLLEFMTGLDPNSRQMSQTHEKLISLKSFFEPFILI